MIPKSVKQLFVELRIPLCGDTAGAGQVGLEICAGLKAIHQLQVIHRDLKVYTLTPNPLHLEPPKLKSQHINSKT